MRYKTIIMSLILIFAIGITFLCVHSEPKLLTTSAKSSKYKILVDVQESKLYVFENEICTKSYNCAGGKSSTPSPIGTWTIVQKAKWGEGFGGSWMRI